MGSVPPKKRRSARKQGLHRSHLVRKLAKQVNKYSPVKVRVGRKAKIATKSE